MTFAVKDLNFANAKALLQEGRGAVAGGEQEYDLSALSQVDSASVAVMVAWQRAAIKSGKTIRFLNAPPNLVSLAKLYGVTELLNLTEQQTLS